MSTLSERLAAQPTLTTERLRLVQLGPGHLDETMAALDDQDAMRLTGTRGAFTREQVHAHLAVTAADGTYLGEVVLNELEEDDLAMNYRIALAGPSLRGQGYGTEAGRAVVDWAFDEVGLHRVSLEVFAFNPVAQRSYEKIGFLVEGRARDALRWDGAWVDAVRMAMLDTDPRPR